MDIITIDFETYYDKDISLSKLTTEEYIRHPAFEIIGVAIKINDGKSEWLSGDVDVLKTYMANNYAWEKSAVLAHNTMFDGAILHWVLGISPYLFLDTMCMARGLHGIEVSASLKKLAEMYEIGEKGDEILNAVAKHRNDFTEEELSRYGDYCVNDVELAYQLFGIFMKAFPKKELKVIDLTLRMFTHPVLGLDTPKLIGHFQTIKDEKEKLLSSVATLGVGKDALMSNPKFAKELSSLGVEPPTKISLRTGKKTFAFAKTDEALQSLLEHDDLRVQTLVNARLGLKSTLEETRTEKFLSIGSRGALPVPIKYYAAHTGRWGGYDKVNLQNLPSRGKNAKVLKSCITAPSNHTLIEADSAQIEARVLAWLAGQTDLITAFSQGEDVYRKMAAAIYEKDEELITPQERFIGKTSILGSGYGMGAVKFQGQLKTFGVEVAEEEAKRIIRIYRQTNGQITHFWREAQAALVGMYQNEAYALSGGRVIEVVPEHNAIRLPSGLLMRYENLRAEQGDKGLQLSYYTRRGWIKIYGGKVVENICQGVARCVMSEQMLRISKKYRPLLTVHDSVICCVEDSEVDEAAAFINECMAWVPEWAAGLPLRGDVQIGKNYGECVTWENLHGRSVA